MPATPRPGAGIVGVVALVTAGCTAVLVAVAALVYFSDYTFGYFSRDPASTLGGSPLVGLLSYVGILIAWGGAVAALLAASYVARPLGWRHASVLLVAAVGLAYLALDDLFQVHEELVPNYLGVPQEIVLATYAGAALAFVWRFRDVLSAHEWQLLALALVVLGASPALDQAGDYVLSDLFRYLEEICKLIGFALLATYLVRLGSQMHAEAYPVAAYGGRDGASVAVPSVGPTGSGPRPGVDRPA